MRECEKETQTGTKREAQMNREIRTRAQMNTQHAKREMTLFVCASRALVSQRSPLGKLR